MERQESVGEDPRLRFDLGQSVRQRNDPHERLGYVVAVMLTAPYLALVRWSNEVASFEPLDTLIEVVQRLL
jgi:hypothetical protein